MTPRWDYLIAPHGQEYNNTKKIADVDLIINTSIEDAGFVNRLGIVCAVPNGGLIPQGSIVVLHHNVFRTYLDMRGQKRKSNEYFRDEKYLVSSSKIYMYNDGSGWKANEGYCFVSPVKYLQDSDLYRSDKKEEEHVGVIKHITHPSLNEGDKVGFTKNSEYEFEIDGEKLYRMTHNDLCLKFN